ncbi:MAG TPA: hypothetical protein PLL98_05725 [Bacillota bacterium]|nr:hypothetical protein [Bacillota bacterium]
MKTSFACQCYAEKAQRVIMLNYMGQKMIGIYGIIKIIIYSHGKGKYSE